MLLLNIVSDEQLLTSQIVKTVLLCLLGAGLIYNLFKLIRRKEKVKRIINSVIFLLLCVVAYFTIQAYRIEGSLLNHPRYVIGTTMGDCSVTGLGQGIEFEYEVDGRTFHNCSTYYPVSKDSIKVPGGKYMVRYSDKFVDKGRMDFNKKANP
ncbi:MAG: hypothetical protein JST10_13685 [Bacteroidetes bacterium]|nr:hypothetical protein [Bacteroidota bacterium]